MITGEVVASALPGAVLMVPAIVLVDTQLAPAAPGPVIILENVSSDTLVLNDGTSTQTLAPGARLLPAGMANGMADGSAAMLQLVIEGCSRAITLTLSSFAGQSGHTVLGQALVGSP